MAFTVSTLGRPAPESLTVAARWALQHVVLPRDAWGQSVRWGCVTLVGPQRAMGFWLPPGLQCGVGPAAVACQTVVSDGPTDTPGRRDTPASAAIYSAGGILRAQGGKARRSGPAQRLAGALSEHRLRWSDRSDRETSPRLDVTVGGALRRTAVAGIETLDFANL